MTRFFYIMDFRFSDRISSVKRLYYGTLSISSFIDEIFLAKLAEGIFVPAFFQFFYESLVRN